MSETVAIFGAGGKLGAAEFGVDPAGFGDFGNQTVDPADIVRGNRGQFGAQSIIFDLFQAFERAAQARQRVLDLMRDIGGKAFHRVDPAAQGPAHVGQGTSEQPDLIPAFGQARDFHGAVTPQSNPNGSANQRAQRLDDGAGQKTGMYYLRTKAATDAIKFTLDKSKLDKPKEAVVEERIAVGATVNLDPVMSGPTTTHVPHRDAPRR